MNEPIFTTFAERIQAFKATAGVVQYAREDVYAGELLDGFFSLHRQVLTREDSILDSVCEVEEVECEVREVERGECDVAVCEVEKFSGLEPGFVQQEISRGCGDWFDGMQGVYVGGIVDVDKVPVGVATGYEADSSGPGGFGFCYLAIFQQQHHEKLRELLGPFPALAAVLDPIHGAWRDPVAEQQVRVTRTLYGDGRVVYLHFSVGGEGMSLEALRAACSSEQAVVTGSGVPFACFDKPLWDGFPVPGWLCMGDDTIVWPFRSQVYVGASSVDGVELAGEVIPGEGHDTSSLRETPRKPPKVYCGVCDCYVVQFGHESRCAPKRDKGWSQARRAAWLGDTVHKMDVQVALGFRRVEPGLLQQVLQDHVSNAAMAAYLRVFDHGQVYTSDHAAGTAFEARYGARFREVYLRTVFPDVADLVLLSWRPPVVEDPLRGLKGFRKALLFVAYSFSDVVFAKGFLGVVAFAVYLFFLYLVMLGLVILGKYYYRRPCEYF